MSPVDRRPTAELLARTHPDAGRFGDTSWLDWLYDANPVGPAIEKSRDRRGDRIGHVGLIPQRWQRQGGTAILLATVNAVTEANSGRALFSGLVARAVRDGVTAPGVQAGYGVTNDASSIPALQRLQARLVCSLPIVAAVPDVPAGVHSRAVTPAYLESAEFATLATLATELNEPRSAEWTQEWSVDTLGWRLAAPGARYAVHWTDELIAVSARTRARGVRVGALMKLIPRRGPVAARQVRRIVGAVHRLHKVPVVVYAGFNHLAPVSGLAIPRRLRPAPLKLFVIGGDIAAELLDDPEVNARLLTTSELVFGAFELLDFDPL